MPRKFVESERYHEKVYRTFGDIFERGIWCIALKCQCQSSFCSSDAAMRMFEADEFSRELSQSESFDSRHNQNTQTRFLTRRENSGANSLDFLRLYVKTSLRLALVSSGIVPDITICLDFVH